VPPVSHHLVRRTYRVGRRLGMTDVLRAFRCGGVSGMRAGVRPHRRRDVAMPAVPRVPGSRRVRLGEGIADMGRYRLPDAVEAALLHPPAQLCQRRHGRVVHHGGALRDRVDLDPQHPRAAAQHGRNHVLFGGPVESTHVQYGRRRRLAGVRDGRISGHGHLSFDSSGRASVVSPTRAGMGTRRSAGAGHQRDRGEHDRVADKVVRVMPSSRTTTPRTTPATGTSSVQRGDHGQRGTGQLGEPQLVLRLADAAHPGAAVPAGGADVTARDATVP
jgi:hypothetical protein